jgi:hypothetical protein
MIAIQKFSKSREYIIDVIMPSLKYDGVMYDFKYYHIKNGVLDKNIFLGRENIYVLKLNLNFHIKYYKTETIKDIIQ